MLSNRLKFTSFKKQSQGGVGDVKKNSIGILTSGGDSQGMNAAVRAVVRAAAFYGRRVYGILEGWQGLVAEPAAGLVELGWSDVGGIMQLGGTMLGTARSAEFRTRAGQKKAALRL